MRVREASWAIGTAGLLVLAASGFAGRVAADPVDAFISSADSVLSAGGVDSLAAWVEERPLLVGAAAARVLDVAVQLGDAGDAANEAGNVDFVRALAEADSRSVESSPARSLLDEYRSWNAEDRALRQRAQRFREEADSLRDAGSLDEAVERLRAADELYTRIGDSHSRAVVAGSLGVVHWYRGDFDAVEQAYRRALELRRRVGDRILEGRTLNGMGSLNFTRGDYPQAIEWYERAAALRRRTGDLSGLGTSLTYAGHAWLRLGNILEARRHYEQALPVLEATATTRQVVENLLGTAELYDQMGRYGEALNTYEKALSLCGEDSECEYRPLALQNEASTLRSAGRPRAAIDALEKAAALVDPTADTATAARIRLNWASCALDLAEADLAKEKAREALQLARQTEDVGLQCDMQTGLASLLLNLESFERARDAAARAVEAAQDLEDPAREREARSILGGALLRMGLGDAAIEEFTWALRHDETASSPLAMAFDLMGRGGARSLVDDVAGARRDLRRAHALLETSGGSKWSWIVQLNLADTFEESDPDSATHWYDRALESMDAEPSAAGGAAFQTGYLFADRGRAYEGILGFFARQNAHDPDRGWDRRAYDVAERSRARGLLELLDQSFALTADHDALAVIDSLYQVDASSPTGRDQQRRLRRRLARLRTAALPASSVGTRTQAASLEEVQSALSSGTAVIQYALADSASWAWAIRDDRYAMAQLPARDEIQRHLESFRDAIAQPGAGDRALVREGRWLYEALLSPLQSHWRGADTLVIVPDQLLFELPFEALLTADPQPGADWSEQAFLARDAAPIYSPSATVLVELLTRARSAQQPQQDLLALGDVDYSSLDSTLEPLPFTRRELESITPPSGRATVLLGPQATESAWKTSVRTTPPRIIHLASHGLIDPIEPARSCIVLAATDRDDGYLHSLEILSTPLQDPLVVLSACESAMGKTARGEGVVGLTRSFLAAGANAVVASLWPVSDESTSHLMGAVYGELWSGRSAREALQSARMQMLDSDRWSHPIYWAPFVVIGSPRAPW